GIQLDNIIVMPGSRYFDEAGVPDDGLKHAADIWGRVGELTQQYGVNLTCHHEFYAGIRTRDQIDRFYSYADPPLREVLRRHRAALHRRRRPGRRYEKHHERVTGFHFKDTRP
ncbi:sugar phosphate isomerase, partial [Microbacterium sp. SUBG005]